MHLISAQQNPIDSGDEAVDLNQSPADIVFLTSTDTELAGLATAYRNLGQTGATLRLASLNRLKHNYSVDLYSEKTLSHARLIVVRLLGGKAYWPYGLEECVRVSRYHAIPLAVMPGCANADDPLIDHSTLDAELVKHLWHLLVEGGPENYRQALLMMQSLCETGSQETLTNPENFTRVALPALGLFAGEGRVLPLEKAGELIRPDRPYVALFFYRALLAAGDLAPVEAMVRALEDRGLACLPIFVTSLKDKESKKALKVFFDQAPPQVIINFTAFAQGGFGQETGGLDGGHAPVLQAILSTRSQEIWRDDPRGLSPRELAMYVALPEVDGRINGGVISFKSEQVWDEAVEAGLVVHKPAPDRIAAFADKAKAWVRLARKPRHEKRIAMILSRYPGHDGGLAHGVGLDSPASLVSILDCLANGGWSLKEVPADADQAFALLRRLDEREAGLWLDRKTYDDLVRQLPDDLLAATTRTWGSVEEDPAFNRERDALHLPLIACGLVMIGLQPERASEVNSDTYHDLGLAPPHAYLAFYLYLQALAGVDAVVHLGKHGTLEWLPGKALALSDACTPEALLGSLPNLYPFIVNDPGEGCQAKRRSGAVIIDHLTPPLCQSDTYDDLAGLERLIDEYFEASASDPRRLPYLSEQILALTRSSGLDQDCGIGAGDDTQSALQKLDRFLCSIKALQIRGGLHCFGKAPDKEQRTALLAALCRAPRGFGEGGHQSLLRALAQDLGLGDYDPLQPAKMTLWTGSRPPKLQPMIKGAWRHDADTREGLEALAMALLAEERSPDSDWLATRQVLTQVASEIAPALDRSPAAELEALLRALDGRFVRAGPSGAPTRGRVDVLPTGRNFYSVDTRALPTPTAYRLGVEAADNLVALYREDHGDWPRRFGLTAWGTSAMRTGGDDIAMAMALIGAKPVWDEGSFRLSGFTLLSLAELGRPRVDFVMRLSGFFRDAFPEQIALLISAIEAVAALDEPLSGNPLIPKAGEGLAPRLFTSAEGHYGGGIKALTLDDRWADREELGARFLVAGGYALGKDSQLTPAPDTFRDLLAGVDGLTLTQDSREFDLLDSDDFFDFEGGLAAASHVAGASPSLYHGESSLGIGAHYQSLTQELSLIVRGRAANPIWMSAMKKHGARGAFEMARAVHALYGYAATTKATTSSHFEALYEAYLADEAVRSFIADSNPEAYQGLIRRFISAHERGFWAPRRNSALAFLKEGADLGSGSDQLSPVCKEG